MKINWTDKKIKKVKKLIETYVEKYDVSCGEDVQQCDRPYQESPELVADIIDCLEIESDD